MNILNVEITGFKTNNGKAYLLLLDQEENEIEKLVIPIANNKASTKLSIKKEGFYALKVFHDENNNQKLDKNLFGIPKEKWGVSNNIKANLGPPNFKKMLFEVKSNTSIQIKLQ